jgi:hypothetical protein
MTSAIIKSWVDRGALTRYLSESRKPFRSIETIERSFCLQGFAVSPWDPEGRATVCNSRTVVVRQTVLCAARHRNA